MKHGCTKCFSLLALFAISISCTTKQDIADVSPSLYRSAKKLEAATNVSVTIQELRTYTHEFATELALASSDSAGPGTSQSFEHYQKALLAYKNSLELWNEYLAQSPSIQERNVIICSDTTKSVAEPYGLDCVDYNSIMVLPKGAIQYLWALAAMNIANASNSSSEPESGYVSAAPEKVKDEAYAALISQMQMEAQIERNEQEAKEAAERTRKAAFDAAARAKRVEMQRELERLRRIGEAVRQEAEQKNQQEDK